MYIHIMNEKMTLDNGIKVYFCRCKKWLPPLCMGFKDKVVAKMHCREYLCPDCYDNLLEGELTGGALYTVEKFLELRNKQNFPDIPKPPPDAVSMFPVPKNEEKGEKNDKN